MDTTLESKSKFSKKVTFYIFNLAEESRPDTIGVRKTYFYQCDGGHPGASHARAAYGEEDVRVSVQRTQHEEHREG